MNRKIKFRAIILTLLLIVSFAICILSALPRILNNSASYTAYIYRDGNLIKTIPLSDISKPGYEQIDYDNGTYNIIEYRNDTVRIIQANCPDQTCVNQGYIYNSLIPITCLPHHLVIALKVNDMPETNTVDAVTH